MGWPDTQYPTWQQTTMMLCYSVLCFPLCSSQPPLPLVQHCQAPSTNRVLILPRTTCYPQLIPQFQCSEFLCSFPATTFLPISRSGTNTVSSRDPSLTSLLCKVWPSTPHLCRQSFNHLTHPLDTLGWNVSVRSTRPLHLITPAIYLETPSKWSHVAQFWYTKAIWALP